MPCADMGAGCDVRVQSGDVLVHGRDNETGTQFRRGHLGRWNILSPGEFWTMMLSQIHMIVQNIDSSDQSSC